MHIAQMQARDFRLFSSLHLDAHPQFNLISGDNGAGKTSLLEALYTLGRGGSWRVAAAQLVRDGAAAWQVAAAIEEGGGLPPQSLKLGWVNGNVRGELGVSQIGLADLVRSLPLQVFEPGMHRVLEEGPGIRRRVLDWGVFHVEHSFLDVWRRAGRALKQRNALLKGGGSPRLLAPWNQELAEAGELLTTKRLAHVAKLEPRVRGLLESLMPEERWQLRYTRGWEPDRSYREALEASQERDRRLGTTSCGPQRAELGFYVIPGGYGDRLVKGRISRGQQKLLVAAFVLAQCLIVAESAGRVPILLLDDFSAELSAQYQERLMRALLAYSGQKFITALEPPQALKLLPGGRMFHVEQGAVRPAGHW